MPRALTVRIDVPRGVIHNYNYNPNRGHKEYAVKINDGQVVLRGAAAFLTGRWGYTVQHELSRYNGTNTVLTVINDRGVVAVWRGFLPGNRYKVSKRKVADTCVPGAGGVWDARLGLARRQSAVELTQHAHAAAVANGPAYATVTVTGDKTAARLLGMAYADPSALKVLADRLEELGDVGAAEDALGETSAASFVASLPWVGHDWG